MCDPIAPDYIINNTIKIDNQKHMDRIFYFKLGKPESKSRTIFF